MRSLPCLVLLFVASGASAQMAASPAAPTDGTVDFALGTGALVGALVGLGVGIEVGKLAGPEVGWPVAVTAATVGMAAGAHGVGEWMGLNGTFRNALGDAASGVVLGAAVGTAAAGLIALSAEIAGDGSEELELLGLAAGGIGIIVAIAVPIVWVVSDYADARVSPTAMRVASGETVPGLSLRIGL
jgi:hypothetical protein